MIESAVSTNVDRDEVEAIKVSQRLSAKDGMPEYKAHKIVQALKIDEARITVSGTLLIPENRDYDPFIVTRAFSSKHMPGGGGYFVRYKDGYESFSPAEAFEEGYDPIKRTDDGDVDEISIVEDVKLELLSTKKELTELKADYENMIADLKNTKDSLAVAEDAVSSLTKEAGLLEQTLQAFKDLPPVPSVPTQAPDEKVEIDDTPDSNADVEVKKAPAKAKKAPDNRKK
jgi:hypothetical protein